MSNYDSYSPDIEGSFDTNLSPLPTADDGGSKPTAPGSHRTSARRPQGGTRRRKKKQSQPLSEKVAEFFADKRVKIFGALVMLVCGLYLLFALIAYISTGLADQSEVMGAAPGTADISNMAGEGGARLSQLLVGDAFGVASGVIIIWMICIALRLFGIFRFKVVNFSIKCLVALITTSLIVGLLTIGLESHFLWGGTHGYIINEKIIHWVGWPGAALLCVLLLALFFIICCYDIYKYFRSLAHARALRRAEAREEMRRQEELAAKIASLEQIDEDAGDESGESGEAKTQPESAERQPDHSQPSVTFDADDVEQEPTLSQLCYNSDDAPETPNDALTSLDDDEEEPISAEKEKPAAQVQIQTPEGAVMTVTAGEIGKGAEDNDKPTVYDPTAELSHYQFPPYNLLRESPPRVSVDQNEQLENQERIRATLADFGIAITDIHATVGPTITLYEIKPEKGVKISRIRNLGDDIALSLAAIGVRIIAPIPGKGTVGIEVANKDPQTVSMRTIVTSRRYQESKYELPIAIGSTINNQVYIADLTKMPHLLVAGATGQGKSVGLNAMIASLLYRKHPAELKFVLVDPKMVEFSLYRVLEKHYLAKLPDEEEPVITKPERVVATLSSLCVEMDARYDLLKSAGVRNIKEYNAKFTSKVLNPEKGHRFMPYIVVVVDEFADLIMTAGKEVETPIARLAQKARAIGIHVILATQRPSANVITGVIKANFPARIAFKVASGVDSRTVLDATGAQQLVGRGDMLVSNNSEVERVQCAFIDTPEVQAICDYIEKQQGYPTAYILPEPIAVGDGDGEGSGALGAGERDPYFEEIARLIVTSNTASTSSLQRRYSIGYNRAGKIMDQLELAGIVGPAQGGKPRQVLVDAVTLESILNS